MNPVNFDEVNCIYKAPKCGDLPVCVQEMKSLKQKSVSHAGSCQMRR